MSTWLHQAKQGLSQLRDAVRDEHRDPPPPTPPLSSRPHLSPDLHPPTPPPPTPANPLLFQAFEWHTASTPPPPHEKYSPNSHWSRLARLLPRLHQLGVTSVWLPPGCKANNPSGNGYDCYDLWDLGEFDQKWTRSTKWGSREELDNLVRVAGSLTTNSGPDNGIQLIWDAVLNHKTAGDACDETWAVEVDPGDRRVEICAPKKIEAWLKYDFPGRAREGMKYSALRWTAEHFSGTDWDQKRGRNAIYKLIDEPGLDGGACEGNEEKTEQTRGGSETFIQFARSIKKHARNIQQGSGTVSRRAGKGWAEDVDNTHGNYDYLIFSNIYYSHPDVRKDVLAWGRWMIESTGIHGFRLDAAQHFSWNFIREWITTVQAASRTKWGRDAFIVGEVWSDQVGRIVRWLDAVTPLQARGGHGGGAWAFDAPLLYSFSRISEDVRRGSKNADLRTLLSGPPTHPDHSALVSLRPNQAVTFVTNHDTQPGQSSFTPVDASLKALFYAFVLLRHQGLPCVFWGDLYGTLGDLAEPPSCCLPLPVTAPSAPCPPAGPPPRSHSRPLLPALMRARHHFAYGPQHDYFDAASCIGWTRDGTHDRPGCVVIMSIGSPEQWTIKKMRAPGCAGERWVDMLGVAGDGRPECVLEEGGWGVFACRGRTVSVYVEEGRLGNMAGGDAVEDVYRC